MKFIYTVVLLLWSMAALPLAAVAQYTAAGTVLDQQTRQPLVGAAVAAGNSTLAVTTDENGRFTLSAPEAFEAVKVQYLGYVPQVVPLKNANAVAMVIALEASNTGLSEVQVVGYGTGTERKLLETPAALSIVTEKDIQRNNPIFLQNTLNQVPGVRMNVRSAASQSNILIRGIGTYGRFSIRGIKLYQNGIPLSEADGTTSLDDLDYTTLGRIDVIKGPASTLYGATLGGVVSFQTRKAAPGTSLHVGTTVGKYGLFRTNTGVGIGSDKVNLLVNYGHQETRGFREAQSNSRKDFVTVAGDFYVSDRQTVSLLATYTAQHDNYAGELDSTDFFTNYRKTAPAYVSKDVGVDAEVTRLGFTHTYRFTDSFANTTSLFTSTSYSLSPVEPNFARVQRGKRGVRSVFTYAPELGTLRPRFALGTEYLANQDMNKRYAISAQGVAGAINSDQEIRATQVNTFAQAEASLTAHTTLTLGASYNVVSFRLSDLLAPRFTGYRQFKPVITPRAALVHTFNDQFSVYAQYSTGFSPPISSQIGLSSGPINPDLKPEKNRNLELGSRGTVLGNKLNYDLTLFRMRVQNGLVQQRDAANVTYFVNSGETQYQGVELAVSGNLVAANSTGLLTQLRPFVSYTYTDAEFKDYKLLTGDFSGKQVTGTFRNLFTGGLDAETRFGLYLNLTAQYTDRTPIQDNNKRYAAAYWLLNSKAGVRGKLFSHFGYDVFAGLDNIADEHYAVSVALNQATPVGKPTFYNPGTPRNWYAGANLNYTF
ncbi:TonB-dependent receptor [Hymenobacter busanensis]|uniref:TonB-dependent receptor n=1 Tax=Hymenobacter busanensis TaxID=2607656 RepID=A0A7L4ZW45_9BACT|nr:TonB-dependent receptor [Hymenobacter busanensis]KAA9332224.1 TonB-dependent receptor [Hymenobacter busanensis]QHJ07438.1 TonB-dependent receptor [Hymenobacter busanensis]